MEPNQLLSRSEGENISSRAFLVGIQTGPAHEAAASLRELETLAGNLGYETCGSCVASLRNPQPDLLIGAGTAESILAQATQAGAETLIFDTELGPRQQRNWDRISGMAVLDRPGIIIGIFADRAHTREAQLQVSLAQLRYELPRLAFSYGNLSRQRGGFFGNKGSGEKKIEIDRRNIREQIHTLRQELAKVMEQRELLRKKRRQTGTPVIALVGYTNAGKSSLHRALAGSEVLVKDALFATLDPSARRMSLPNSPDCILVDTVGFVRNLPHSLIEAFKATLEEVHQADLVVHVMDASDPDIHQHWQTTMEVLGELDARDIPRIGFLNKWDLLDDSPESREQMDRIQLGIGIRCPRGSTVTGEGIEGLRELLSEELTHTKSKAIFTLPYHRGDLKAAIHRSMVIQDICDTDEGYRITAFPDERMRNLLAREGIQVEPFRKERS